MGKNCWKEGRNLNKMGLEGLSADQIKSYLKKGETSNERK